MKRFDRRGKLVQLVLAVLGSGFIFGSCDPTLRATTEQGIIDVSTGLIGAYLQAFIQVALEAANA
ncbi:MAG: hypothetical protein CHACPFDD_00781 [Phycisphaerae bacterium]|nr:hypothetical protein [Phycisphaerae bacterium]